MNKQEKSQKVDGSEIESYDPFSSPHGLSYGAWTVKWWKWCFSIERSRNPTLDTTGNYAAEDQTEPTWFLAGTWVSQNRNYPHRKCLVPSGVSILFPVINCEENPLEYPELKSRGAMKGRLCQDMNTVEKLDCSINGFKLIPQRVPSDPEFFNIEIRSDMAENRSGGQTLMTADGYWVFLKPLPKNDYCISFEGSYQHGKLYSGAIYDISIL